MSTIRRGNLAEAAVIHALVLADIDVLVPFGDGSCYDVAAELPDERIVRIQVKCGRVRNGCVEFNAASTDHGRGRQHYRGRADLFGIYLPPQDRVFIVPVKDSPSSKGYLRLVPTRNNQTKGVRLADDYDIARWVESLPRPRLIDPTGDEEDVAAATDRD